MKHLKIFEEFKLFKYRFDPDETKQDVKDVFQNLFDEHGIVRTLNVNNHHTGMAQAVGPGCEDGLRRIVNCHRGGFLPVGSCLAQARSH